LRIQLLGSDSPLGEAVQDQILRTGRHETVEVTRAACRWKSERQAKKDVRRAECDLLLDTRLSTAVDGGEEITEPELEACHWLAKACRRSDVIYFLLSSYRLFSGDIDRLYSEEDNPDGEEAVGRILLQAEGLVREGCERHVILRLGPVFSHREPNWLPGIMHRLQSDRRVTINRSLTGNPVAAPDAARVICGIIDQLGAGARAWGIYHYCSSESATAYALAEAALASASQFVDLEGTELVEERSANRYMSLNRALDCRKIRNTFAIRQEPWRDYVGDAVKRYFHQSQEGRHGAGRG
jgi:dTDP-4-dehydrorhamnose reductase